MLIASIKKSPEIIPACVDAVELRLDLNPSLQTLIPSIKKPLILKTRNLNDVQYKPTYFDCDWQDRPLRKNGLICSRHIDHTPDNLLQTFAELMQAMPADIYKLATTAHSTLDALRMLIATRTLRAQGKNVIGLCMGELGQITRIVSEHTYAYLDEPTAPGQLSIDELTTIYRYPRSEKTWYGLIGDPIEQSPSHITHNQHCFFLKMRIRADELSEFFTLAEQLPFHGLAATIPHKEAIEPGKVINTLLRKGKGWQSFNTDGQGVLDVLGSIENKRIALLGAGGAAKAIALALKSADLKIYNRTAKSVCGQQTLSLDQISPYDILINATSCGMLSEDCPIHPDFILPHTTVFETICKPEETTLIKHAKAKSCSVHYGKELFHTQAKRQFDIWLDKEN